MILFLHPFQLIDNTFTPITTLPSTTPFFFPLFFFFFRQSLIAYLHQVREMENKHPSMENKKEITSFSFIIFGRRGKREKNTVKRKHK